ncbi:MAG: DUF1572 domain-containing protein [Sphingobacteriales bacterium]|jgi:hypothetical protein|nr:MAG: DUF1572 domain-containing protein [Sphingobacteriales bacterium]
MSTIGTNYLQSAIKRLLYYKELAEKTFAQLSEEDLFYTPDASGNSIAIIVQHLAGNMLSRFTGFLTEDGEKPWRHRDAEFEPVIKDAAALLAYWQKGWDCCVTALQALQEKDLQKTIYIRTEPLLVIDAINRQLAHYPYHVGQIVFLGKQLKGSAWQTLSIAKGQSAQFNNQMQQQSGNK